MKIWTLHPVQGWNVCFRSKSPMLPLDIQPVTQNPWGLSFFIWRFQCDRGISSGSLPTAHSPALSSTSRIANRFRYCSLKGWIWRICRELGLIPTWYHPFPFALFPLVHERSSTPWAAPAGCPDTLFEQTAWVSGSITLFNCLSRSCPRIRWAWSWSGGLREMLQAVSSAAVDECGWLHVWEQKSSPYFATGCFGSRKAVFLASLCLPFLKVK